MVTFSESYRELSRAQKPPRGVSYVTRFVVRPMGRVFAALGHSWGLTSNTITLVSSLVTLAGITTVALVTPSAVSGVLACVLLLLGFGLDSADGQVARLSGTSSLAGEWLDHVADAAKMVLVHAGVLLAWYRLTDLHRGWLLVPLAFQVVAVVLFSANTLAAVLRRTQAQFEERARTASRLRSMLLLPVDYGLFCLSFLLWGAVDVYAWVYSVLLVLNVIVLGALLVKWFLDLRRADADPAA